VDGRTAPTKNGLIHNPLGWLAHRRFEFQDGGIKIQIVRLIYQSAFRKIAEIRPQSIQEVGGHFGTPEMHVAKDFSGTPPMRCRFRQLTPGPCALWLL
jgi:hypothetical protein